MSFFFFKQKTAYEMRISDWSSDVCSSDLSRASAEAIWRSAVPRIGRSTCAVAEKGGFMRTTSGTKAASRRSSIDAPSWRVICTAGNSSSRSSARPLANRSEEHTSELQSLMRISYAVFCLKKKKTKQHIDNQHYEHSTSTQLNR